MGLPTDPTSTDFGNVPVAGEEEQRIFVQPVPVPAAAPAFLDNPIQATTFYSQLAAVLGWTVPLVRKAAPWVNFAAREWANNRDRQIPSVDDLMGSEELNQSISVFISGVPFLQSPLRVGNTIYAVDKFRGLKPLRKLPNVRLATGPREGGGTATGDAADEASFLARAQGVATADVIGRKLPFYNSMAELSTAAVQALSGALRTGGGAGRQPLAFDEDSLLLGLEDRWRKWLLEEPDGGAAKRIVTDYMKDASSFWRGKGGRLDFDTYVTNRMRSTSRYQMLYGNKPEHVSEDEWIGGFLQTARATGISERSVLRQVERGASTGISQAGFAEQVGRSREAVNVNQGGFSQRLAATAAGLGALMQS